MAGKSILTLESKNENLRTFINHFWWKSISVL